jgi:hypothetical protein
MADELIPEDVRDFITDNIDSVAELEALLLIRSDPDAAWSTASLARRLYATREQTQDVIAKLCSLGLVGVRGKGPVTYHYQPSTADLDKMVSDLAETYSKYLVPVTNLIHSKPHSRIQQFADAFKLRKEDK